MRVIRHSKLPIKLVSEDRLTYDMLHTIKLNMMYDEKDDDNESGWTLWVDEYGNWFNPYKPNPNQIELF